MPAPRISGGHRPFGRAARVDRGRELRSLEGGRRRDRGEEAETALSDADDQAGLTPVRFYDERCVHRAFLLFRLKKTPGAAARETAASGPTSSREDCGPGFKSRSGEDARKTHWTLRGERDHDAYTRVVAL
jgi:hypothetical protein